MSSISDAQEFEEKAKGLVNEMAIQPGDTQSRIACAQVYATLALLNEVRALRRNS